MMEKQDAKTTQKVTIGLGIDTGGTYTDAVIYDYAAQKVLACAKALTTKEDLSVGIGKAMDNLPADVLGQVQLVSLSTTLATNACVEDRGGRAKLIFIGADKKIVEETGGNYGLPAAENLYFLDAVIHADGGVEKEPDWELFAKDCVSFLHNADSAAVVSFQGIHNPVLEQKAKEIIAETCGMNAVCGHELFWNLNYIKRGASTLLNARLIPVIESFLQAIRHTMEQRHLQVPVVIVRSDGTLMSEAFSRERPVETILCGPAASVMGGMKLANTPDCLVVDMGGTTTDIAIVKDSTPVKVTDGVTIGKWSTFVNSVQIHTFGLGGDSRIHIDRDAGLAIGPSRVLPLCVAAERFENVRESLKELMLTRYISSHPLQEFFYLIRDISDDTYYTEQERAICRALQGKALRIDQLAQAVGSDLYVMDTDRLERETIIMRCGLTPTDIMHVRGDFSQFDGQASLAGANYVAARMHISVEELCGQVYDQVQKMMYVHIVKMLLENQDAAYRGELDKGLQKLIERSWDRRDDEDSLLRFTLHTPAALVGIGAPIHLFLPEVARALGTRCIIPENAPVANALGAAVCNITATSTVVVEPSRDDMGAETFYVYAPSRRICAADFDEAIAIAKEEAQKEALAEAKRRGADGDIALSLDIQEHIARVGHTVDSMQEVCLSVDVIATAAGGAGF